MPFLKNALAVESGDSGPDAYRRAFHRLICGLEHKEPGADGTFRGNLRFPEPARGKTPVDDRAGDGFPAQVMRSLDMRLPLMILAPVDTHASVQVDALRLEQDLEPGTVVRLADPNGNLAGAKGEQPWRSTRIQRLGPGETATLYGGLYAHLTLPSRDWPSGTQEVGLRLVSANAPSVDLSLPVDLRLPSARWQNAVWDRFTETLEVSLDNPGDPPLGDARVSAEWWATGPPEDRSRAPEHRSAWQEIPALEPGVECHYLALASEVLTPRLASILRLPGSAGMDGISRYTARTPGRFLFLIDEADKFIRHERQIDYRILGELRRISEEGHCSFILARFWELFAHAVLDYQSPLKNFGEVIEIGDLDRALRGREIGNAIKGWGEMISYVDSVQPPQGVAPYRRACSYQVRWFADNEARTMIPMPGRQRSRYFLLLVFLGGLTDARAEIYTWTDADGQV